MTFKQQKGFLFTLSFWILLFLQDAISSEKNLGEHVYIVQDEPTLGEISVKLYGTTRMWKKIAEWNELQEPFRLSLGQKLKLKVPPKLTKEAGDLEVLNMWRKRLGTNWGAVSVIDPEIERQKLKREVEEKQRKEDEEKQKKIFLENLKKVQAEEGISVEELKKEETFEQFISEAQQLLKEEKIELALLEFQKAGKLRKNALEAMMGEMRCLKLMDKLDEAKIVGKKILKLQPELVGLPIFQSLGFGEND